MSDKSKKTNQHTKSSADPTGSNKPGSNDIQTDGKKQDIRDTDHMYKKNARLVKLSSMETDLKGHYPLLKKYEDELKDKYDLLKPYTNISGDYEQVLTPFAKKKLKREVNGLKQKIKNIKAEIKRLEKLLASIYKGIDDKISRANVRKSAQYDNYHERYGYSIKKRIDDVLEEMPKEKLAALKAEVPKAEIKVGNAMMMKALVNAPRFLHTRVVSNPTARDKYLQYFRRNLTGTKGKFRKK